MRAVKALVSLHKCAVLPEPLRLTTIQGKQRKGIDEGSSQNIPGRVAQSVTCLTTDECLIADPGVTSLIPARSHTFMDIDHEIISTVIPFPSADSFKKGCCQLQAKVCA